MKNLIILVIIILFLVLAAAGYFWYKIRVPAPPPLGSEDFTQGTLPDMTPLSNPLEKKPDINPLNKANPFKGLYKNPFE